MAQTSLTLESAKSTDTLHDVANPLYGDSPAHLPASPQGPIYSAPQPASEEAKRETDNYPYSYASVGTGRGTSVKGASGSLLIKTDAPTPASNNYEYIKMGSVQPLSPSLNVTNEAPRASVYDDDFHYAVIDAISVTTPTQCQEPNQQTSRPKQTSIKEKKKPILAPKPNMKNGTPPKHRSNGSIKLVIQAEVVDDDSSYPSDMLNSYDRLDHGLESTPTGMTVRLAKMEGSGYEALQS